jgi:hypothetical protein
MGILLRLLIWVVTTTWARTTALALGAVLAIVGGFGQADEAVKYKKGAQTMSLETMPAKINYDFVKLDALSDGGYVYFESSRERSSAKDYTIFYPVYSKADYDKSLATKKPRVTAIVKDMLESNQEFCVQKESCLKEGVQRLTGRVSNKPFDVSSYTDDKSNKTVFDLLNEDLTIDKKTVYIDADWRPSTSEGAGGTQLLGVGLLAGAVASVGVPRLLHRRAA